LTSWLLDEPSDAKAVATIAASDLLRSEAAMALPALRQAALRPATHDEIKGVIGSRFATYPQPQRSEGEAAAFFADYFDALGGLTAAQVEAGMAAHVREPGAEFLPKPGRLRELAKASETVGRWTRAHNRARSAVERARSADAPRPASEPRPSREEIAVLVGPVLEKLTSMDPFAQARAKASQPTPGGRPDEHGVSPEMRALMQRQGRPANRNEAPAPKDQAA
jgi:hypothetical protein